MKKVQFFGVFLVVFLIHSGPGFADDDGSGLPWKKGYINLGYYFAELDSSVRFGSTRLGIGIDLDMEELLGLDTTERAFRLDAGYRLGKTQRHKVEFNWFKFKREGSRFLNLEVNIPELPDGSGGGSIGPGESISTFYFDIAKFKYEYSFILDKRIDFNVGAGLYVMPIEFGFTGTINGVGSSTVQEDITAPLPVVGVGFDLAISPKWYLRQQADFFYLEISKYRGVISSLRLALEYLPWKHFGFGVGFDSLRVQIEAEDPDTPGIDFRGNVRFNAFGAQLYLKAYL
ncbi:MAG: hypothetical protein V3T35_06355 [Spirochaetia bacterium]